MKLWLDDLRPAPEGWTWAKTADEAILILMGNQVRVASLDHDLADEHYRQEAPLTAAQIAAYNKEKTGYDVVLWMEQNNVWPERVIIHSFNPNGARRMADVACRYTRTIICPYTGKEI